MKGATRKFQVNTENKNEHATFILAQGFYRLLAPLEKIVVDILTFTM